MSEDKQSIQRIEIVKSDKNDKVGWDLAEW